MDNQLDEQAVRHVATLAMLRLSDDEVARFSRELSSILGYVAQLDELDTADVPPTAHPLPVSNVFRDDAVQPSWPPDQALRNAPSQQDGFFQVPKVLDQEGP